MLFHRNPVSNLHLNLNMHYLNNLLPPAERDGICSDSEDSDATILSLLASLKESVLANTITSKDIGFCILKISLHCNLQYELTVSLHISPTTHYSRHFNYAKG